MNLFASSFKTAVRSDSSAPSTTPSLIPDSDYGTASSVSTNFTAPTTTPPLVGVPTSDDDFKVSPPTPPLDTTTATCLKGVRNSYGSFKAELVVVLITHTTVSLRFLSGARPTKSSAGPIDRLPAHA
jgi:hypothetical protein